MFWIISFSVGVPFGGDIVNLKGNPTWEKAKVKHPSQIDVVMSDSVTKVNRADAKVVNINYFLTQFQFQV